MNHESYDGCKVTTDCCEQKIEEHFEWLRVEVKKDRVRLIRDRNEARAQLAEAKKTQHDENCDALDAMMHGKPCNCYLLYKSLWETARITYADSVETKNALRAQLAEAHDKIRELIAERQDLIRKLIDERTAGYTLACQFHTSDSNCHHFENALRDFNIDPKTWEVKP